MPSNFCITFLVILITNQVIQLCINLQHHSLQLLWLPCAVNVQVLVTPVGRLKASGLGVAEALTGEVVPQNADDLTQLQRDDVVVSLGLSMPCPVGMHHTHAHTVYSAPCFSSAHWHLHNGLAVKLSNYS